MSFIYKIDNYKNLIKNEKYYLSIVFKIEIFANTG